ncbi:MAG: AmmeMemoRadiSam system radical SAM enzyme [Lachnospiraceae bacterium]|nr:AmmeMemoRadiSam system radical SAM enzyme [Lachnospiraceae bacterium]
MVCPVCFRHCNIVESGLGFCGVRTCKDGVVVADNYGKITSIALDPIEKKPLAFFYPGSMILSVGSYGCSLRCPFCQNHEISWSDEAMMFRDSARTYRPEEIADLAERYKSAGNIGVAYTYNEPLAGYEFVRDTARLVHERGMKNVLVTSGNAELSVLSEIAPYMDAMNIDLKGFTDRYYTQVLGGNRRAVMDFIEAAVKVSHVELTTLIVPGENDSEEEMRALSAWVAGLEIGGETGDDKTEIYSITSGRDIPLHISRFFPRFHMTDRDATDVSLIYRLAEVARENLDHVLTGNC